MSRYVVALFPCIVAACGSMSGDGDPSEPLGADAPSDTVDATGGDDANNGGESEAALQGWHWEDASGEFVTDEDSLGFVDERGFFWFISMETGRVQDHLYNWSMYFAIGGCAGPGWIAGSAQVAMTPFTVLGRLGFFYIRPDGPVPARGRFDMASQFASSADHPSGACSDDNLPSWSGFRLDDFEHDEDLKPPDVQFTPPFVRVRD